MSLNMNIVTMPWRIMSVMPPGSSADTDTSVEISSLSPNTTYYWQLRSSNASGTTYANDGVWWSFTTEPVPGAFSKISPVNKATNRPPNLKLSWGSSDFAEEYQYCLKLSGGTMRLDYYQHKHFCQHFRTCNRALQMAGESHQRNWNHICQ